MAMTTHPNLAPKVKEIVELYFCSPSGLSWPVQGRILPLPLPCQCLCPQELSEQLLDLLRKSYLHHDTRAQLTFIRINLLMTKHNLPYKESDHTLL